MVGGIFGIPAMSKEEFKTIYEDEIRQRNYELLKLSEHIEQVRNRFCGDESLKLLETTLKVQAEITRDY